MFANFNINENNLLINTEVIALIKSALIIIITIKQIVAEA